MEKASDKTMGVMTSTEPEMAKATETETVSTAESSKPRATLKPKATDNVKEASESESDDAEAEPRSPVSEPESKTPEADSKLPEPAATEETMKPAGAESGANDGTDRDAIMADAQVEEPNTGEVVSEDMTAVEEGSETKTTTSDTTDDQTIGDEATAIDIAIVVEADVDGGDDDEGDTVGDTVDASADTPTDTIAEAPAEAGIEDKLNEEKEESAFKPKDDVGNSDEAAAVEPSSSVNVE